MPAAAGLVARDELLVGGIQEQDAVADARPLRSTARPSRSAKKSRLRASHTTARRRVLVGLAGHAGQLAQIADAGWRAGCPRRSSPGPRRSAWPRCARRRSCRVTMTSSGMLASSMFSVGHAVVLPSIGRSPSGLCPARLRDRLVTAGDLRPAPAAGGQAVAARRTRRRRKVRPRPTADDVRASTPSPASPPTTRSSSALLYCCEHAEQLLGHLVRGRRAPP